MRNRPGIGNMHRHYSFEETRKQSGKGKKVKVKIVTPVQQATERARAKLKRKEDTPKKLTPVKIGRKI